MGQEEPSCQLCSRTVSPIMAHHTEKPANRLAPKSERKRHRIKQIGRFFRVYLVQSVHAPHSKHRGVLINRLIDLFSMGWR
jgi:polynucleotide 5'-kinase involved in rRNA processing